MKNGVVQRGKERKWSYVLRVPDPITNKIKNQWVSGFSTETEAKLARDKARVAIAGGQYVAPSKMTVGEFLTSWIEIHAHDLKPSTELSYRGHLRIYLIPRLGKIPLSGLRASNVQKFYGEMRKSGGKNGAGLSARTVHYSGAILSKALKYAVEVEGLIPANPVTRVPRPKGTPKRLEPYSPEEMKTFLTGLRNHPLFALFRLAAYSGARSGELLALKWSDINLEKGRMTISRNRVTMRGEKIEQESTKGGTVSREISLDSETGAILRAHRRSQLEDRMKVQAAGEWTETGYVFVNEFGAQINSSTPNLVFRRNRQRLAMRDQRFHDLRHFHATQHLRIGTPLHVVANRLGHKDVMTTARIYAHVTQDQKDNLGEIFAKAVE